jgi:hypothetical protein
LDGLVSISQQDATWTIWQSVTSRIRTICTAEIQHRLYQTSRTQHQQLKLAALAIGLAEIMLRP